MSVYMQLKKSKSHVKATGCSFLFGSLQWLLRWVWVVGGLFVGIALVVLCYGRIC